MAALMRHHTFSRPLSKLCPAAVYVVTYRRDYERAKQYVDTIGIRYSEIILVARFQDKAIVIKDKSIGVCFDDQDEMRMHIPDDVVVMKIRNGGNLDSASRRWLYSKTTGRQI